MSDAHELPTLAEIDRDGALADAAGGVWTDTRGGLLRTATLGGAALLGSLSLPATADGDVTRRDRSILNYALTLEYLQAAFYTEAERLDTLKGDTARQARTVGAHERSHVQALRGALGRKAVRRPTFDFRGTTESPEAFRRTAVAFEDLSVAAYAAQAPRIEERSYLVVALGILSVEARHASWIRRLAGRRPAARAFDEPRDRAEVTALVEQTGFVESAARPRTTSRRRPRFTG